MRICFAFTVGFLFPHFWVLGVWVIKSCVRAAASFSFHEKRKSGPLFCGGELWVQILSCYCSLFNVYIVTSTSLYFRLVFFSSCVVRLLNLIFLARFLCYRGLLYLSLLWEFVSWEGLVGFWSDGWAGVGGLVGVEEGKTG